MDFGLREVLILVGFLMIAGIILDGYRRMRKSKLGELDLPPEMGGNDDDEWDIYTGELPNGGARKVSLNQEKASLNRENADKKTDRRHALEEDDLDLDIKDGFGSALDDDDMDMPMETVRTAPSEKNRNKATLRPAPERKPYMPEPARQEPPSPEAMMSEMTLTADPRFQRSAMDSDAALFDDDDLLMAARSEQQTQLQKRTRRSEMERQHQSRQASQSEPDMAEVEIDPNLQEVLVVNVMARNGELPGSDLLRVMQSCGFRYGDMNIFHRYEQHSGKGGLLFSVANVVEPGIFDINKMDSFSTPGICLFMKLPGPKRAIHGFEVLMDSARRIASLLDADIKDEHHNVMRQQTVEHYRQRVLEFERKYMSYKAALKQS